MKTTKTILIVILSILLVLSIGLSVFLFIDRNKEKDSSITIDPGMSDSEVVQYLKDQLTQTQQQLTDSNILLQGYLKQLEETNNNNATLTEKNKTLTSTIESLQETVKSLNAEIQRLTKLLEEYGNIAEGTWEVHFYDGEEMIKLLLIRNNSKIAETVTAEKDGFDFKGWATEQGGQVVDYQNIEITQATNFYAVFERASGLFNGQGVRVKTWDELVSQGDITVSENSITKASVGINGYLVVPDSITEIGRKAFENCERLVGIDCYGVTKIWDDGFRDCYRLREVNYGEEIAFGQNVLVGCQSLRSITLPKNTSILNYPFLADKLYLAEVINYSSYSQENIISMFRIYESSEIQRWEGIHTGESRIKTIEGVNYYIYNEYYIAVGAADDRANLKISNECNEILSYAFIYQDQLKNVALREMTEDTKFALKYGCFSFCTSLETFWVPTWFLYNHWDCTYESNFLENCPLTTVYIESRNNPYGRDMTKEIEEFMADAVRVSDYPGPKGYETDMSRKDYLQKFGF